MGVRIRILMLVGLWALAACRAEEAGSIRSQAAKAEKAGDTVRAYLLYSQAAAMDASDRRSWAKSLALRRRAVLAANLTPESSPGHPNLEFVPNPISDEDREAARSPGPPSRLQPATRPQTFDLNADSKIVAESVLRSYGIDTVFDSNYQPIQGIRFRLPDVGFEEALIALQAATASFVVPVSEKLALVARDTTQKRQELEHSLAVAVPIPTPVTVQEATELARGVQQLMEIQKFGVDSAHRMVVFRDRASKVLPALAVFEDLMRYKAEVHLEVEFLEVADNSTLDMGLKLPQVFLIRSVSDIAGSPVSLPALLRNLARFSPAKFFAVGIADTQIFGTMSESSSRTLSRAELRASEGQPVTFHVGDRYPILTAGYFGATGGAEGQVYTPPPSFNFEDLGLVLKITPRVHGADEIGMDLEAEYKVLTGQALNGIPVIANRKFTSRVRLKDGELAVVSGLVRMNEARALSGIAGLAQIPGVGALFRQDNRSTESGQALLTIRPRIVGGAPSEHATRTVWTGPEGRPRIPL
jgi:hypothetical protein